MQDEFSISDENIKEGLLHVARNTGFMGRWQQLQTDPTAIADTAHNSHGLKIVMSQLQSQKFDTLRIVLGVVNDKDLTDILPLMPKDAVYYFCKPGIPRGLDALALQEAASGYGLKGGIYDSVQTAYQKALEDSAVSDFIYVGGSTFVVAEVL